MKKNAIGLWAKEIAGAAVGALLVVSAGLQDDGNLNNEETIAAAIAFLAGILLVAAIKNAVSGPLYYAKAILQGLVAAAASFSVAIGDAGGWPPSSNEWVLILLAFLGGAGITTIVSNSRASDPDQFKDTRPQVNPV